MCLLRASQGPPLRSLSLGLPALPARSLPEPLPQAAFLAFCGKDAHLAQKVKKLPAAQETACVLRVLTQVRLQVGRGRALLLLCGRGDLVSFHPVNPPSLGVELPTRPLCAAGSPGK